MIGPCVRGDLYIPALIRDRSRPFATSTTPNLSPIHRTSAPSPDYEAQRFNPPPTLFSTHSYDSDNFLTTFIGKPVLDLNWKLIIFNLKPPY